MVSPKNIIQDNPERE